jgi:hypothetical protein
MSRFASIPSLLFMIDASVRPIGTEPDLISLQELSLDEHGVGSPGSGLLPGVFQWMIKIKMQQVGGV